jgi:hypothetical protein
VIKDNLKTDADGEGDKSGRIEGIKGSESAAKSGGPLGDVGGASATSELAKTETSPKTESSTSTASSTKGTLRRGRLGRLELLSFQRSA